MEILKRWMRFWSRAKLRPDTRDADKAAYDLETDEMVSEIYAQRWGKRVKFVSAEDWSRQFNALPAEVRLFLLYDLEPSVKSFRCLNDLDLLICCHVKPEAAQ